MSVHGPTPLPFRPVEPAVRPAGPATPGGIAPPARRTTAAAPAPPAESTLWELLTDDEREFFSQQASLGALTYGRVRGRAVAATPAGPIGQRLDVRG